MRGFDQRRTTPEEESHNDPENLQWLGPAKRRTSWLELRPFRMVLRWLDELLRCPPHSTKVYAAIRYGATFHDGVEDLVDIEEISEENKKNLHGSSA